jgi:NAD(P)-dependent dehydrogenase (short-subunit alcohol dehydrogenase family)
MRANLDGMVILITGAARGIGAAIAAQAAEAGAEALVLVDRDPVTHRPALRSDGRRPTSPCPTRRKEVIAAALARFGRIDGLVNAAGLTTRGGYGDATVELLEPHVLGQHARAVLPDGRGHRRHEGAWAAPGSIVNILSMNAHCGQPDLAVYSATKGALQTLTKNAATRPSGRPHPGQRHQSRLDGHGDRATPPRRDAGPGRGLARRAGGSDAAWPSHHRGGLRAAGRLDAEPRLRADDGGLPRS